MRTVHANGHVLMLTRSEEVHGPFTLYLNSKYSNPNSRTAATAGLRLMQVFFDALEISLPHRALEGKCLSPLEIGWLTNLAYRPLKEIEAMTPRMLVRLVKTASVAHRDRDGAVTGATASVRLVQIASFLDWYFGSILDPRILSALKRRELKDKYQIVINELKNKINGANRKHPTQIRSLPIDLFKKLITTAYRNPEFIFPNQLGDKSTLKRDRAVFLLACEGVRPGAIGNLMLSDFRGRYLEIKDNAGKRGEVLTSGTPVQKGSRSNMINYNSEYVITLWPWTTQAINEYINSERENLLSKRLKNNSKGFLFLEVHGAGPIRNRKTIGLIFKRAEEQLLKVGLLQRDSADPYVKSVNYDLVAYTLRHSAATLFALEKGICESRKSEMKDRFGWTPNSNMPDLYAKRASMDLASVDLSEWWNEIK